MFSAPDDEVIQSAPSAQGGGFSVPDNELVSDDYWADVQKNAMQGLKEFPAAAKGMATQAGKIVEAMGPGSLIRSGGQALQGTPIDQTTLGEGGKAAYELGKGVVGGAWQGVKDTGSLVKSGVQYITDDELPFAETEIGQKFRERPISVPLGVAGTLTGLRGGFKALRGKPTIPESVGAVPEGGISPNPPGPGASIPPEAPAGAGMPPPGGAVPPPPSPMGTLEGFAKQFAGKVKSQFNDTKPYINRTYQAAHKSGMIPDLADYTQEASQMMSVRAMGGSPLYATQGIRAGKTPIQINDELRAIGQYGLDKKIVVPELGNNVMLNTQAALQEAAGNRIGGTRMMADEMARPVNYTQDVLQQVTDQLAPRLSEGAFESGPYKEALDIVKRHEPTYEGMGKAATELNKEANKANRNHQPHTPFTEVANIISDINNERIKAVVGPEVGTLYEQSLREFGVNKKIQNMLGRKVGQELHRTGPGTLTRAAYQKFLDEIGYKGGAKVLNRLSGKIKANPAMAGNLPELFKTFINEVADILPGEEAAGMAYGGIVGEMDQYLTPKYGGTQ